MNAFADIFADTTDYAAKARAIARRQVHAPVEARKATRPAPLPLAIISLPAPDTVGPSELTPIQRTAALRKEYLDAMTHAMTAGTLAAMLGRSRRSVAEQLFSLKAAGLVEICEQGRGNTANLWRRTGMELQSSAGGKAKSPTSTQKVLAVMDRPMLASEIASALKMTANAARMRLSSMEQAGLVKIADKVRPEGQSRMAFVWVRT